MELYGKGGGFSRIFKMVSGGGCYSQNKMTLSNFGNLTLKWTKGASGGNPESLKNNRNISKALQLMCP